MGLSNLFQADLSQTICIGKMALVAERKRIASQELGMGRGTYFWGLYYKTFYGRNLWIFVLS